ncbi:MAG TPA: hypothetical protein ENN80_14695, partial [Candidatus Hydrogenedentes bacterium]|nr:hypothetical protein [Candidatus Hydrogenedentota bacterium]
MSALSPEDVKYSPGRVFLVAMILVAATPVYWLETEIRGERPPQAGENEDLYQGVYPALHYGFERMRNGDIPLWNPHQACGVPFLADCNHSLLHPINIVFCIAPTERAMALQVFVGLTLMGLLMVLFLRELGVGYSAALAGGVAYAFSGASASMASRPALLATMACSPMLFWALRVYSRHWRMSGAVLTGLALALLVLAGAPA